MITMKEIGKNLKFAREEKEITVYNVEKDIGIKHQSLYNYENGKQEPSIIQCIKLSEYYGIELEKLIFLK